MNLSRLLSPSKCCFAESAQVTEILSPQKPQRQSKTVAQQNMWGARALGIQYSVLLATPLFYVCMSFAVVLCPYKLLDGMTKLL